MYIEEIEITFIEPCYADPKKLRFKAVFFRDISEVLPYLNADIRNALYSKEKDTLAFVYENRVINLFPNDMSVIKVLNTTDAYRTIEYVKELINEVYRRRCEIEPMYERRRLPSVIDILRVLPADEYNCGACDELTCLAFASKLLNGERTIQECLPLRQPENRGINRALSNLLSGD